MPFKLFEKLHLNIVENSPTLDKKQLYDLELQLLWFEVIIVLKVILRDKLSLQCVFIRLNFAWEAFFGHIFGPPSFLGKNKSV